MFVEYDTTVSQNSFLKVDLKIDHAMRQYTDMSKSLQCKGN